jgi:predicted DNA-binding WGR domain protein
MDALPFAPVELVAIDPTRNVRRRWAIVAARDLFGAVIVETGWGRIGARGRTLVRTFDREGETLAYVRALLTRRGSAVRRIGVGYVPAVSTSVAQSDTPP